MKKKILRALVHHFIFEKMILARVKLLVLVGLEERHFFILLFSTKPFCNAERDVYFFFKKFAKSRFPLDVFCVAYLLTKVKMGDWGEGEEKVVIIYAPLNTR